MKKSQPLSAPVTSVVKKPSQFRYQFAYPVEAGQEQLPVVVQRYLRPGEYELILKVEDSVSRRRLVPGFCPSIRQSGRQEMGAVEG